MPRRRASIWIVSRCTSCSAATTATLLFAEYEYDYLSYLQWLGEVLAEAECALHAYVLMTNTVHLLLTPKRAAAVPGLIIALGRRYVQYINRTGTLWDSRYKPSTVLAETYLLACQRTSN